MYNCTLLLFDHFLFVENVFWLISMLINSAYSCDQFRTMEKRKGSPISIKLNIIRQGMMSKENLWIINLLPIKHLSLLINPWEKLWSYLQHACLVTWPPTLCCGTVQKEAPAQRECTHWAPPSSTAAFKEPSKGSEKNHNLITMRTALAAVAIVVLALGWTSEAVHVEVKCTCPALWASVSLLNRSRLQNPPVAFGGWAHFGSPSDIRLFLPGERTDFLTGGRQEASGAVSEPRRDGSTEPPTPGQHHVPMQRPHAPAGVCEPLQAEERLRVLRQTGWVLAPADRPVIRLWECMLAERQYLLFFSFQWPFLWTSVRSAPSPPAPAAKHAPTAITRPRNIPPSPHPSRFKLVILFFLPLATLHFGII